MEMDTEAYMLQKNQAEEIASLRQQLEEAQNCNLVLSNSLEIANGLLSEKDAVIKLQLAELDAAIATVEALQPALEEKDREIERLRGMMEQSYTSTKPLEGKE